MKDTDFDGVFVNGNVAREKINRLAAANRDFLFVIDYRGENCIVEDFANIRPSVVKFAFRGVGNAVGKRCFARVVNPEWHVALPKYADYERSFNIVKNNIRKGNSYLVNLTAQVGVETNLLPEEIFECADAPYKLWVKDRFVCFSPETFIRINAQGTISSFPMKGTISAEVANAEATLIADEKESAEHATIVDLIRNDLSIVAHGVHVARYRYVDVLETNRGRILQTSSEIRGSLDADFRSHIGDILFAQLPAGSITGAPKPETMRIIGDAENYERGFYTGVMGCWTNGTLDSAVMIRYVENQNGKLFFKAGGGITAKSDCKKEYQELIQKVYVPIC